MAVNDFLPPGEPPIGTAAASATAPSDLAAILKRWGAEFVDAGAPHPTPAAMPVVQIPDMMIDPITAAPPPQAGPPVVRIPDSMIDPITPAAAPRAPGPKVPAAAVPIGAPAVSPPAAAPGPVDAAAGNLSAAGAGQEAALGAANAAGEQGTAEEAAARDVQAQEQAALLTRQQEARQEATALVEDRRRKAEGFEYHDLIKDASVAKKIQIGIGMILGGIGRGQYHNPAAELVQASINREFEKDKLRHARLFQSLELAQQQGRDLSSSQLHELSAFRQAQADKLQAIIKRGDAMAAKSRNALGVAELKKVNAKLGLEAAQAQEESHRAAAAAIEREKLNKSTIDLHRSQAVENYAQAAKAKAGAAGEKELAGETFVGKMAGRLFPERQNAMKTVKNLEETEQLIQGLKANPSALQVALTKERLVSAFANGGRPSVVALNMAKKGGGSWLEMSADQLKTALTGKAGAGIVKNMTEVANTLRNGLAEEVKGYQKKHDSALSGVAKKYPDAVQNHRNSIFGTEEVNAGPPEGSMPGKLSDGRRVFRYPDNSIHLEDGSLVH